jgi:RNA polymerase-binding transcription factor DksA
MVTRSLDAIVVREPVTSMTGKEDKMSPASKATAAKKVPASPPPAAKKAVATKKTAPAKAAAAKAVTPTKSAPPTKKAVPTKNAVSAKPSKKPAPVAKNGGPVNKETTITKKAAPAAKKTAGPAKKAASATKAAGRTDTTTAGSAAAATSAAEVEVVAPAPVRTTFTPKPKAPAPVRPKTGPYAKDLKFLEEIVELLAEERGIYQEQATSLRAEADSLALEREPGDVQFDEESGEGGTVTVDRERNLALSGQAALAVEEIDFASIRVGDKTYGYCERCFQPIPKPRLRALPYARLCVACKSGGLSRR